jgi:hypothetical protein
MAKTSAISVRVTDLVKAAAERAADEDHRPLASYVEKLLIEHLKSEGYLDAEPPRGNVQVADAGAVKRKRS